jgi:hypothetical protein
MHRLEVNKKVMSYMTTDRFYELQIFSFSFKGFIIVRPHCQECNCACLMLNKLDTFVIELFLLPPPPHTTERIMISIVVFIFFLSLSLSLSLSKAP